jgi:hypothetical protein
LSFCCAALALQGCDARPDCREDRDWGRYMGVKCWTVSMVAWSLTRRCEHSIASLAHTSVCMIHAALHQNPRIEIEIEIEME